MAESIIFLFPSHGITSRRAPVARTAWWPIHYQWSLAMVNLLQGGLPGLPETNDFSPWTYINGIFAKMTFPFWGQKAYFFNETLSTGSWESLPRIQLRVSWKFATKNLTSIDARTNITWYPSWDSNHRQVIHPNCYTHPHEGWKKKPAGFNSLSQWTRKKKHELYFPY